jgi:hypothetical protein
VDIAWWLALGAVWLFAYGVTGYGVAASRGRGVAGFFLGALLGPFGVAIAGYLERSAEAEAERRVAIEDAIARLRRGS